MQKKPITSVNYGYAWRMDWTRGGRVRSYPSWWFQPSWKSQLVKMDYFFQVGIKTKTIFVRFFFLNGNFMNFCWRNQFLGRSTLAPFIFVYLSPVTCLGRGSNLAPFIFFNLCAGVICLMDLSRQVIMATWGCQCSLVWICVLILPILHPSPCSQALTKWKAMKIASNRWTHKPKMKITGIFYIWLFVTCVTCVITFVFVSFAQTDVTLAQPLSLWKEQQSWPIQRLILASTNGMGTINLVDRLPWNGKKLWSFCNALQFDKSSSAQDFFLQNLISWCISASCCWP